MSTTKIAISILSALLVVRSTNIDYAVAAEILRIASSALSATYLLTILVNNPHIMLVHSIPKHIHLCKDHYSFCSLDMSTSNFYLNRFFIIFSPSLSILNFKSYPTSLSILFTFLLIFFIDFFPFRYRGSSSMLGVISRTSERD